MHVILLIFLHLEHLCLKETITLTNHKYIPYLTFGSEIECAQEKKGWRSCRTSRVGQLELSSSATAQGEGGHQLLPALWVNWTLTHTLSFNADFRALYASPKFCCHESFKSILGYNYLDFGAISVDFDLKFLWGIFTHLNIWPECLGVSVCVCICMCVCNYVYLCVCV